MSRGHDAVAQQVPHWRPSPALAALDRLVDVAAVAMPTVARRSGLSETEMHALRHLAKDDLGPADLARALGVTPAAATGILDRLAGHGYVERRPHPVDRRRTIVDLTDDGREEVLGMLMPMFRGLAAADARLDDHEREVVTRFLNNAIDAIGSVISG